MHKHGVFFKRNQKSLSKSLPELWQVVPNRGARQSAAGSFSALMPCPWLGAAVPRRSIASPLPPTLPPSSPAPRPRGCTEPLLRPGLAKPRGCAAAAGSAGAAAKKAVPKDDPGENTLLGLARAGCGTASLVHPALGSPSWEAAALPGPQGRGGPVHAMPHSSGRGDAAGPGEGPEEGQAVR